MRRIWTDEQIELLKTNFPTMTVKELRKILPYTEKQIARKAAYLKLKKSEEAYTINLWEESEIEVLKENYNSKTVKEIMELLPRFNEQQIRNKIFAIGLKKNNNWTPDLEKYLVDNYNKMSIQEMKKNKLSQFTESAIYRKIYSLGLKISNKTKWEKEDEEIMRKFFPIRLNKEMVELLPGFTEEQIKNKGKNMGLKKTELIRYKARSQINSEDRWTDEELKILIEHYSNTSIKDLIKDYLPNRTSEAIKKRASMLGIQNKLFSKFIWTAEDLVIINSNKFKIKYKKDELNE